MCLSRRSRLSVPALLACAVGLAVLLVAGCKDDAGTPFQPAPDYTDLSPGEALALIDGSEDAYVIDVSSQYASGSIPGSVNYSLEGGVFESVLGFLSTGPAYLVYAHDDETSIAAARMMIAAGFPTVYRLDGNFQAWISAGFPIALPGG